MPRSQTPTASPETKSIAVSSVGFRLLDTVARCFYELGQLDKAIKWQRLAAENNNGIREIGATLERYLKEKSEAEEKASAEETETKADEGKADEGEADEGE